MPSSPLALLHQLLRRLDIPIFPPTLSSTPPSLLLLLLETLVGYKLALPSATRLCKSRNDELAIVKCVLGVLADDLLAMDLAIIDPIRVVRGSEPDIAVIVLALIVVARRRNVDIDFTPADQDRSYASHESLLDEPLSSPALDLPPPIKPDPSSRAHSDADVFGLVLNTKRAGTLDLISAAGTRPQSNDSGSTSRAKTVLQEMVEEFGLEPSR